MDARWVEVEHHYYHLIGWLDGVYFYSFPVKGKERAMGTDVIVSALTKCVYNVYVYVLCLSLCGGVGVRSGKGRRRGQFHGSRSRFCFTFLILLFLFHFILRYLYV